MATERPASPAGKVRYGHTSIVAIDWRRLADFYTTIFGCEFVPPERNYSAEQLEPATGVPGSGLRGVHLRLPGHGPDGPTLEIYQYDKLADRAPIAPNRVGLAHIAFIVDDVAATRAAVIDAGGSAVGEIVTFTIADGREVSWCYLTDPEGNLVEPVCWKMP
jgi:catechol 2,3-dioxygenase-like lactoylglutathione lyase family enzyme